MVTKDIFDELFKLLGEKDDKIAELEDRVKELENQANLHERRLDDLESYGRRQNLRIVGIPPPANGRKESADEVLEKVKDAIVGPWKGGARSIFLKVRSRSLFFNLRGHQNSARNLRGQFCYEVEVTQ